MPGATEPLRSELRIAAPPEVVFPYFTDPARMVSWMGVAALLDPRPGGTFRVERQRSRRRASASTSRSIRRDRVVFTWGFEATGEPSRRPVPRASRSRSSPTARAPG